MIPASELQPIDYKILSYLNNHGRVKEDSLCNAIGTDHSATTLRISLLSTPDYTSKVPVESTSYIKKIYNDLSDDASVSFLDFFTPQYTGYVEITDLGKKAIEDFTMAKHKEQRQYLIKSVFIPAVVSFVTAILTTLTISLISKYLIPYL